MVVVRSKHGIAIPLCIIFYIIQFKKKSNNLDNRTVPLHLNKSLVSDVRDVSAIRWIFQHGVEVCFFDDYFTDSHSSQNFEKNSQF